jgi:hypothetical protein
MDNLKKLQDEAAEIANRIDAVRAMECESDADIAARDMDLTALVKRADDITGKIDFEVKVAESANNIRSVVDRCTPAREQEETRQVARIEPDHLQPQAAGVRQSRKCLPRRQVAGRHVPR